MRVEPIKRNESLEREKLQREERQGARLSPGEFTKGGIKEAGKEWSRGKRKLQRCGSRKPNVHRAFTGRASGVQRGKQARASEPCPCLLCVTMKGYSVTPPS